MSLIDVCKRSMNQCMLVHRRFYFLAQMEQGSERRQTAMQCWIHPIILLLVALAVLSINSQFPAENREEAFATHGFHCNATNSWTKNITQIRSISSESYAEYSFDFPSNQITPSNISRNRIFAIGKRIVFEIGILACLQSIGIPFARILFLSQRWSAGGWRFLALLSRRNLWRHSRRILYFHRAKSPRSILIQKAFASIKRIYKRRARLSAMSDMTHVMGDDAGSQNESDDGKTQCKTL